jgi:hypothetical protein
MGPQYPPPVIEISDIIVAGSAHSVRGVVRDVNRALFDWASAVNLTIQHEDGSTYLKDDTTDVNGLAMANIGTGIYKYDLFIPEAQKVGTYLVRIDLTGTPPSQSLKNATFTLIAPVL